MRCRVDVIPGIPGMVGCWNATGVPITWGDDVLTVLMGTLPEADLVRHMQGADALAIMKTGRNLPRVRRALAGGRAAGRGMADRTRHHARAAGGTAGRCGR
jgi:precorrin-2/cobalt-factor-2 C20-methyltransferase